MANIRILTSTMALALAATIAACAATTEPPKYPEIRFQDKPPIALTVETVELIDEYAPPLKLPNVEHEFPISPAEVASSWARDRLSAAGGSATARVSILEASVIERELETTKGVAGLVKDEQAQQYDATLNVRIEVMADDGARAFTSVKIERSRTVPESVTLNEREQIYYEMSKALGQDLDREMEKAIRQHLNEYRL